MLINSIDHYGYLMPETSVPTLPTSEQLAERIAEDLKYNCEPPPNGTPALIDNGQTPLHKPTL